jgi:hypothetical protein
MRSKSVANAIAEEIASIARSVAAVLRNPDHRKVLLVFLSALALALGLFNVVLRFDSAARIRGLLQNACMGPGEFEGIAIIVLPLVMLISFAIGIGEAMNYFDRRRRARAIGRTASVRPVRDRLLIVGLLLIGALSGTVAMGVMMRLC